MPKVMDRGPATSNGAAGRARISPPLPEIDDATRREFLIGAAGLLLLAPGCGSGEGGEHASGGTRTVEPALGTTEVPVKPEQVVAMHPIVEDTALALGFEPVGIQDASIRYLQEDMPKNVEVVGYPPNIETIAALGPDLIVGLQIDIEETYDELSRIAPTVAASFGDGTGDWQRSARTVAEALGKTGEFEAELATYKERAGETGRRLGLPDDAPTIAIMRATEEFLRFELPGIFSGSVVYGDVGLPLPEGLDEFAESDEGFLEISREEFGLGDADEIFLYTVYAENPEREVEAFREDPVFQTLRAAETGSVYAVRDHWFAGSLLAANLILDDLEKYLLEDR